jgi:hypothetical protein
VKGNFALAQSWKKWVEVGSSLRRVKMVIQRLRILLTRLPWGCTRYWSMSYSDHSNGTYSCLLSITVLIGMPSWCMFYYISVKERHYNWYFKGTASSRAHISHIVLSFIHALIGYVTFILDYSLCISSYLALIDYHRRTAFLPCDSAFHDSKLWPV